MKNNDNKNEIIWSVINQVNNEKFLIEHRLIDRPFQQIGEVQGHGTSLEEKKYSFIHENPPFGIELL